MALWLMLEDCKEGFRPALKYVEDRTGIKANKISEIRKELIEHGIIALTKEMLLIDWERVQIFASLEKPLPKHGKLTYAPVKLDDRDWSRIPLAKTREYRKLHYRTPLRRMEEWEVTFFSTLEQLTEKEYESIVLGMSMDRQLTEQEKTTGFPSSAEEAEDNTKQMLKLTTADFAEE